MPRHEFIERPILSIANANKPWVVRELDKLRLEWAAWLEAAKSWDVSPDYDPQTCAESIMDGRDNIRKHAILREKTLTFIGNNFTGYGFLFTNWPQHPHETNQVRLARVIPDWIRRLDTLAAAVEYARVPDSFWKEKGKELVTSLAKAGPEKAVEIATKALMNPLG